jgi:hypothetical protein
VRILWWSGVVIVALSIARTVAFAVRGIVTGDVPSVVINASWLPIEIAFRFVLWARTAPSAERRIVIVHRYRDHAIDCVDRRNQFSPWVAADDLEIDGDRARPSP